MVISENLMPFLGVPIGVFIGIIVAVWFLFVLEAGSKGLGMGGLSTIVANLVGMAGFVMLGNWFTESVLAEFMSPDFVFIFLFTCVPVFLVIVQKKLLEKAYGMGKGSRDKEAL